LFPWKSPWMFNGHVPDSPHTLQHLPMALRQRSPVPTAPASGSPSRLGSPRVGQEIVGKLDKHPGFMGKTYCKKKRKKTLRWDVYIQHKLIYYIILFYIILYYTTLYYIILYIILYYIILYYIVLHYIYIYLSHTRYLYSKLKRFGIAQKNAHMLRMCNIKTYVWSYFANVC
jgi:hypothetical protein